jgi:polyhydroxyalkanoate synthesis regulator phasin
VAPRTDPEQRSEDAAAQSSRAEQSLQAFRDALEKSVTISRERLQEVMDDAVRRGRMTRGDAEELAGRLLSRGREQVEDILGQLESTIAQVREASTAAAEPRRTAGRAADRARRELEDAAERARGEVGSRAQSARKRAVDAVEGPLATADRARRRARVPGFPISAYDRLNVRQIDRRLAELTRKELRKVRSYEERTKNRKGIIRSIDRKLDR